MKQILYINVCVRPQSRTAKIALHLLEKMEGEVTELRLSEEQISPHTWDYLQQRDALLDARSYDHPIFHYARQFASADEIVIAAPYWDLSFPAALKNYIEVINCVGITFAYDDQGRPYGLCRAKRLIYVTTAGGPIISDEPGFGYIRALAETFYQIPVVEQIKAQMLDMEGADVEGILQEAMLRSEALAQKPLLQIRHTKAADLSRVMEIFAHARTFMAATGNPNQWGPTNWPPEQLIREDIRNGCSYVCLCGERIVGTFFFTSGIDVEPTYLKIDEGEWLGGENGYGVVHRIASDGSVRGTGAFCIRWAARQCSCLRIDTHPDNRVMQNLLTRMGFEKRGIIYVREDNDPRYAYELIQR